ncbi:C4-dicarboxylate-binding periplasmic protein precursor [Roseivivax sp. THAF40]|uniref:C4-dicarboxylate TRAP transporter substrate-binding protein n=1 Tax=unclassified Roseivivax TaxID=2639302 RepID=UPI001268A102|nr:MULTISPECIES: C4-dicarboxylate TRAP transporter substrate-binding protein [unclassified Roseivivax]QFS82822.1 C4-dicarboxylate-binding periplasmic protein precursor [Roseivivax sp. THAF197b]QFT46591.1 C4-dicarboxylate-binding periplasmic protein precursor [Roseivivax sp. THAF40]
MKKTAYARGCVLVGTALSLGATPVLAEDITLRIGAGHPNGPAVYVADVADFFVPEVKRRVAEETEHTIEFVEGYGGAIAGVAETLESVQNGILDIGAYCICFEPAKLFLHNFPYYTPFGPQDAAQGMEAVRATYDAVPWLTEQFTSEYDQVLLGLHGWDNYHLGTTDPWETVDDLQGVKIGGAGPNLPWLEFAGAVPVQSTLPDGYLSLQTGVYNGWLMFPSAYLGFKFYEPSPYYTLIGFGAMGVNALTMNQRKFDSLPEDVRQIIVEVGRAYEDQSGASNNARQAAGLEGLREVGAEIRELSAEARAGWAESLVSFPNQQAKDADGRGMPGTEVMKTYIEAVAATGYEMPVDYTIE